MGGSAILIYSPIPSCNWQANRENGQEQIQSTPISHDLHKQWFADWGSLAENAGVADYTVEGKPPPPFNIVLCRRYGSRSARCIY